MTINKQFNAGFQTKAKKGITLLSNINYNKGCVLNGFICRFVFGVAPKFNKCNNLLTKFGS
ncbi:hypothetical protein HanPSC8_Chr16g0743671 [Helianthus annuus]|nr:hypothetical protein HanPSC8_Chr16g0743671 [Helianthus annuus]